MPELERYDAGYLGGEDACSMEWWHDYMRAELARAHDFYQAQCGEPESLAATPPLEAATRAHFTARQLDNMSRRAWHWQRELNAQVKRKADARRKARARKEQKR